MLGVSLSTLYCWRARYQAKGLRGTSSAQALATGTDAAPDPVAQAVPELGRAEADRAVAARRVCRVREHGEANGQRVAAAQLGGLDDVIGKVVQADTMMVKPYYRFRFKQFTSVDGSSRMKVSA